MKSPAIRLIPRLIALALSSSLIIACASQDSTEQNVNNTRVTTTSNELAKPVSAGKQTVAATEEDLFPRITLTTPVSVNQDADPISKSDNQIILTEPEQRIFYFGFDKVEITLDDIESLKEHADFLKNHTQVVVAIDGHTDHHGPRLYNEYLSKKRAESIAKVLIDEGVPESQLLINALADSKPLECKNDTSHNRRVELHYKDGNLASIK